MKAILRKSTAKDPFSFVFVDTAGNTLIRSENYAAKESAKGGIESVKKNCASDARYELKEAKNGKVYFNLKSSNGQVVGTSGMFADAAARDRVVALLKQEGASAAVEEQAAPPK